MFWNGHPNTWGKTPAGKPLYRIVWSDSRQYRIGGCWGDNGEIEYRWAPYYAGLHCWVLEKWLSAREFAGTKEDWEQSQINQELAEHGIAVFTMGPYPSSGWYEHLYTYPSDGEPNLQELVDVFEASKSYTFQQCKTALALYHERKKKEWENRVMEGLAEAQPAFGHNPTSIAPSKPHMDTGGLSDPAEVARAILKHRGLQREQGENAAPEDLNLPSHGFSIKQRKS